MKHLSFNKGVSTLQLSWEDFATLLPSEVSKKVAEYAGENITPNIMVDETTGKMWAMSPLFANLKHDPKMMSPIEQPVSTEAKAALKAKGRITWKDAEKIAADRRLMRKLFQLGYLKFEEVDGILLTIPEADIIALNAFVAQLAANHEEK